MSDLFGRKHGVIVACDVKTLDALLNLVDETCTVEGIVGYKIGFVLALRYGLYELMSKVREITGTPVIYDHQKAGTDIPQMGEPFAEIMSTANVNSAIIFPQAGPATQEAFVHALLKKDVVPIVGGHMTHPAYLDSDEQGKGYIRQDAPTRMYKWGVELGAEHFVVPGNQPEVIKKYVEQLQVYSRTGFEFMMPGIGRQGGDITFAFEACKGFNAYAIVGSSIYKAKDVAKAAERFCKEALNFEEEE